LAEAVKRLSEFRRVGAPGGLKGSFGVEVSLAVVGVPPRLDLRIPKIIETRKNFYGILKNSCGPELIRDHATQLNP